MLITPEAEKLFNEALTLAPGERETFLAKACSSDKELLDEVSSLLTAANESEAYFDGLSSKVSLTSLAQSDEVSVTGKVLGQWKLLSLLGRGGMGSVYLAERADGQFEKQVALKTLPIGLDNELARTRFINERQILARLVHDNIARLLDGGVSEDGTPYFVMDYVEGKRIDAYCRDHNCSIEQQVDLVLEVARGVQFAHRNLVIHRDLKPTNILIDSTGHARLLDFGIAKVLESTEQREDLTMVAQRPITPAYASPEMLRGESVDVTTDVYSLGVVLYQLVTGSLPLDVEGLNLAELHAHVSNESPALASRLNRKVDDDLDAVLAKALAKDPSERYESIEGFAQDLRNWRKGLPVVAKAPSAFYRVGKFVRRNVAGVGLASLAVLSLVGFAAFASYSAVRSEQQALVIAAERDRAEATKEFLVSIFDAAGPKAAGEILTASQILERGRLRVNEELADQPRLQTDMLQTIASVYSAMGFNEKRKELLYEAKDLVAQLDGNKSRPYFDTLLSLAQAEDMLGDYDAAENIALELIDISVTLDDDISEGDARGRLGRMLHLKGDYTGADREYRHSLALFQRALGDDSMQTARAKLNLATLLDHTQHHQEAYEIFLDVEDTYKRVKTDKEVVETGLHIGMARALLNLERYDESLEIYQRTLDLNTKIYGADYSHNLYILSGMGGVAEAKGDFDTALELQNRTLRLLKMHTPDSPNVGRALLKIARVYQLSSRCELAIPVFRQALKVFNQRLPNHAVVGQTKWRLGVCLTQFAQNEEAETLFVDSTEILSKHLAADHKELLDARSATAAFYKSVGKAGMAERFR